MTAKQTIHTAMIGRTVQIKPAENFLSAAGSPYSPQARYHKRANQLAVIVNVYLKDGSPVYDLLFLDGQIEEAMLPFGFTVEDESPTARPPLCPACQGKMVRSETGGWGCPALPLPNCLRNTKPHTRRDKP